MIKENEQEEIVLNIPDPKTIPCLTCKWGMHNFLANYCVKYNLKSKDVYYENAECPKYEKIENNVDKQ